MVYTICLPPLLVSSLLAPRSSFIARLAKLCSRYFGGHKGFSIGIDDVTPSVELQRIKDKILTDGYEQAQRNITSFKEGKLQLRPGCNAQER